MVYNYKLNVVFKTANRRMKKLGRNLLSESCFKSPSSSEKE